MAWAGTGSEWQYERYMPVCTCDICREDRLYRVGRNWRTCIQKRRNPQEGEWDCIRKKEHNLCLLLYALVMLFGWFSIKLCKLWEACTHPQKQSLLCKHGLGVQVTHLNGGRDGWWGLCEVGCKEAANCTKWGCGDSRRCPVVLFHAAAEASWTLATTSCCHVLQKPLDGDGGESKGDGVTPRLKPVNKRRKKLKKRKTRAWHSKYLKKTQIYKSKHVVTKLSNLP